MRTLGLMTLGARRRWRASLPLYTVVAAGEDQGLQSSLAHPFRNSSQVRQNEVSHVPINATDRAILAVLFSGIGLALFQFFSNRSLWFDEAMLAISIVHRGFDGLLQPLELNQVAPILFLQLEKIFFLASPHSDLALRIFPLTAWLLSVILFSRIARSMLPGRYAIFAVTLVVFNPTLLRYSGEVKQYSSDVLLATSIAYLSLGYSGRARPFLLGLAGVLWGFSVQHRAYRPALLRAVPIP